MTVSNELILRKISDLMKQRFFISFYQRGYRWTQSPAQTRYLGPVTAIRDSSTRLYHSHANGTRYQYADIYSIYNYFQN